MTLRPKSKERIPVALIGSAEDLDLKEAIEQLRHLSDLSFFADPDQAALLLKKANRRPALLIFAQTRRGCFSHDSISRLQASFPLSRSIALLGSWCEGEERSGMPWPGVIRVYWHQWLPRLQSELARLSSGTASPWGMCSTSTDVEQTLLLGKAGMPQSEGRVVVSTPYFDSFDALSDLILSMGMEPLSWASLKKQPRCQADLILWDAPRSHAQRRENLASLQKQIPDTPAIGLVDFPRRYEIEDLRAWGVEQIISRPFQNNDLAHAMLAAKSIQK